MTGEGVGEEFEEVEVVSGEDGMGESGAGVMIVDDNEVLSCAKESKWNLFISTGSSRLLGYPGSRI